MIAGCPHIGMDSYCERLNRSCEPTAKGCVLYGKVRLSKLKGAGARMSSKLETNKKESASRSSSSRTPIYE